MSCKYCYFCMTRKEENEKCPCCGTTTEYEASVHHLKQGTVLRDKYLIGKAIGEGGFGITYVGRDLTLDMKIAVKEYYPNGFCNRNNEHSNQVTMSQENHGESVEKEMQRFLSEARILARFCNDPGVVGVRDFFRENGTAYIVMEYLDGITLKNYLKKYGRIPFETFTKMIDPILLALHEIHNQGLIHRDISPDNIMLLKNGRLKLLDFGAAREVTGDKSLSVVLKPGYAPEEQYRTRGQQGPWTDVYAMSATIYKCITGVMPEESIQRVFEDNLKKPSELGVEIPKKFERALMQGLAVKSTDRLRNIDVLRNAIFDGANGNVANVQFQGIVTTEGEVKTEDVKLAKQERVPRQEKEDPSFVKQADQKSVSQQPPAQQKLSVSPDSPDDRQSDRTERLRRAQEVQTPPQNQFRASYIRPIAETPKPFPSKIAASNEEKRKNLKIIIAIVAVSVIIVMGLFFGALLSGNMKLATLEDSLPSERAMARDCNTVLKREDISGGVLDVRVVEENLNEKFKTYVARCETSVLDGTSEKQYIISLRYEYGNNEWELSNLSSIEK